MTLVCMLRTSLYHSFLPLQPYMECQHSTTGKVVTRRLYLIGSSTRHQQIHHSVSIRYNGLPVGKNTQTFTENLQGGAKTTDPK